MVEPNQQDPNSLLPAQGAAPGAAPGGALANGGLDSMVAGYLQHITDVQKQSPLGQAVAAAKAQATQAAQQPVDTTKPPAPPASDSDDLAPGSFGSKLSNATSGGGLGDAAHAHDTKGGWLSGLLNTANARNKRLQEEQNNQMLHAKTQAETLALHRNLYNQSEQIRQAGYKGGQDFTEQYRQNHDIKENVNHTELANLMKDPKFVAEHYIRAIGEEPVIENGKPKLDADGDPVTHPMYSIINKATKDGSVDDKTVTPEMSADAKKYTNYAYPSGTKLTTDQHAAVDTAINLARTSTNVLNESREKPLTDEEMKSLKPYLTDPTIQAAISHVPGSAYAGLLEYQKNADAHIAQQKQIMQATMAQNAAASATVDQRLQNLTGAVTNQQAYQTAKQQVADLTDEKNKVANFTAAAIDRKQVDAYEKKNDDAVSTITDLQKKADAAHGEEAAAMSKSVDEMLKNNTYTPQQTAQLQRIQKQTSAAAQASQDWETEKERRKAEVTNALETGDTDTLVDAATNYQLDPNKLYSMRKNTNAEFKAKMLQKDPTWSEATYKQRYNMQQDLAKDTQTSMGGQVQSLNQFAYHTGAANDSIQGLRNLNSPILNTAINKVKSGTTGFEEAQKFKVEAEAAKDEFLNFIKNGHVPPSDQELRLADQINMDRTPAELQSTFRAMASLVAARGRSMNGRYSTIMGGTAEKPQNIPGLLNADTQKILSQFGIDVNAITAPQNQLTSMSQTPAEKKAAANTPTAVSTGPKGGFNPQVSADGKTTIWQLGNQWVTADGKPYKP